MEADGSRKQTTALQCPCENWGWLGLGRQQGIKKGGPILDTCWAGVDRGNWCKGVNKREERNQGDD